MAFTCPRCKMTSHNPNDEANEYCSNCHAFVTSQHYLCPVCSEMITVREIIDPVPPHLVSDAMRALAEKTEHVLKLHVEAHTAVEVLERIRALQAELERKDRDAIATAALLLAAAGGEIRVPDSLVTMLSGNPVVKKWTDEANNVTVYQVQQEVPAER